MFRVTRWIVVFAAVVALVAVTGSPAFAIFRQLQTTRSGPDLNGQVPEGDARVDQSELPRLPGQVEVRVKNVNLSDGSLDVFLAGVHVGRIPLSRGEGMLSTSLPFQVGRLDLLVISDGTTTVLFGGRPWKVYDSPESSDDIDPSK